MKSAESNRKRSMSYQKKNERGHAYAHPSFGMTTTKTFKDLLT